MLIKCILRPWESGGNPVYKSHVRKKTSEASSKPSKTQCIKKTVENEPCLDIDSLNQQWVLTRFWNLFRVFFSLLANSSQNENTMEQSFSHNQPNAIISRPSKFVSLNQNDDNTVTLNDFDFIYLDSVNFPNSSSISCRN